MNITNSIKSGVGTRERRKNGGLLPRHECRRTNRAGRKVEKIWRVWRIIPARKPPAKLSRVIIADERIKKMKIPTVTRSETVYPLLDGLMLTLRILITTNYGLS